MIFETQRQALITLCIRLSRKGYFAATGGNIMLRLDDKHVAVTPSATDYFSMTAADICILTLENLTQVDGIKTPSVEASLHAQLLRRRPDVHCSIHTHQPLASACTLLARSLPVPDDLQPLLGKHIPRARYAPSGTRMLAKAFAAQINSASNAYLMTNHGIVCAGRDTDDAMQNVAALEHCARQFLQQNLLHRIDKQPPQTKLLQSILRTLQQETSDTGAAIKTIRQHQPPAPVLSAIQQQQWHNWQAIKQRLQQKNLLCSASPFISARNPDDQSIWGAPADAPQPEKIRSWQEAADDPAALHLWIYARRPDITAIVSGCGTYGQLMLELCGSMPGIFDEQVRHTGIMPPPADSRQAAAKTLARGGNIASIGDTPLVMGMTAERLILNAELFEKRAKAYLLAAATGQPVKTLPWPVRYIANRRLRKDQQQARLRIQKGLLPEESTGY